jgi:hypothetical protein
MAWAAKAAQVFGIVSSVDISQAQPHVGVSPQVVTLVQVST